MLLGSSSSQLFCSIEYHKLWKPSHLMRALFALMPSDFRVALCIFLQNLATHSFLAFFALSLCKSIDWTVTRLSTNFAICCASAFCKLVTICHNLICSLIDNLQIPKSQLNLYSHFAGYLVLMEHQRDTLGVSLCSEVRFLREGVRKKNTYFLWSFAKPPLGPPPRGD